VSRKFKMDEFAEDYALSPVPAEKKRSWWDMFLVWLAYCTVIGCMYTGVALGTNMTFRESLIALTIGNVVLLVIMALTAYIGAKTGLATAPLFRMAIGRFGTYLFSAIIAFTSLGWFGVQCGLFGQTWSALLPWPVWVLSFIGGLLMMATATIGFKGLAFLSKLSAIPLFLFVMWGLIETVRGLGGIAPLFEYEPAGTALPTMGIAVSTVFGSWAVGSAIMADVARYARPNFWKILGIWAAGLFLGHYVLPLAGIAFALKLGTWDFGVLVSHVSMLTLGSVLLGTVIVSLAQWTTNDNNLYSAALAFNNIVEMKKWKVTAVLGVIATIAGALGVVDYFVQWMTLLGQVIPPMAAILISEYLILPALGLRKHAAARSVSYSELPPVYWPAGIAWAIGVIVGLTTPGISAVNGLLATVVAHVALSYAVPVSKAPSAAERD